MDQHDAQLHVLNVLDDIAWVLNVRGGDVLNTPVVMSYLVIGQKHVNWFVDETKVDEAMRQRLADEGVNVRGYDEIIPAMQALRDPADQLEMIVDKDLWPLPSYGDLIFEV